MESSVMDGEVQSAKALNGNVKPFETGLIFWADGTAEAALGQLSRFGLHAGQLGVPPTLDCAGALDGWRKAHADTGVALTGAACSYAGENYSSMARVHESVGFTNPQYRAERIARTKEVAAFVHDLGITSVSCHIGFIPAEPSDPLYDELVAVTRELCDSCDGYDQAFALETGQETAAVLLGFISDVDKPNLKVNFDPANMVMYGSGDPVKALTLLRPWVLSVHCKDGTGPTTKGTLGREVRLGDGAVDFSALLYQLKVMDYRGTLTIEREEPNQSRRDADIKLAVVRLQQWKAAAGLLT